ncbi:BON domain-containing protein [Paraburkholderia sp.]|jgi:osmotically-inducible protein OsmY|uniref:BON domain-containing protein n=1 Tax=Paraburkholderia sp. TaxID=1926495 RepID=UPI002F3E64F8
MTTSKKIAITLLATAALFGTTYASAQSDAATTSSSPVQSKKAVRAQNRELVKTVRHALTHTKNLDSSDITVLAKGGVVTLDGTVPSDDQIQRATDATSSVPGVTSVRNNLILREAGN